MSSTYCVEVLDVDGRRIRSLYTGKDEGMARSWFAFGQQYITATIKLTRDGDVVNYDIPADCDLSSVETLQRLGM